MLWIKALHIIFIVCWFAGLFYLPRLFVYHAESHDEISLKRFAVMEHKLFYFIMTPTGILTTLSGLWLLSANLPSYLNQTWMIVKLIMVALLWGYHLYCRHFLILFKQNKNSKSSKFFRFFNEIPTILLIIIVIMAIVKP